MGKRHKRSHSLGDLAETPAAKRGGFSTQALPAHNNIDIDTEVPHNQAIHGSKNKTKLAVDKTVDQKRYGFRIISDKNSPLMNTLENLSSESQRLRAEVETLSNQMSTIKESQKNTKAAINPLDKLQGVPIMIRQRFLDLCRDKMNESGTTLQIDDVGDCVADSLLYTDQYRNDQGIFRNLYGLDPDEVNQVWIAQNRTAIKTLDQHATHWAQKNGTVSYHYQNAFIGYVKEQAAHLAIDPNSNQSINLKTAYLQFLAAHDKEPVRPS